MAELSYASYETILRRSALIAQGRCSPAEYRRMVREKQAAAHASARSLMRPGRGDAMTALLVPWLRRASANAKRLRRRK